MTRSCKHTMITRHGMVSFKESGCIINTFFSKVVSFSCHVLLSWCNEDFDKFQNSIETHPLSPLTTLGRFGTISVKTLEIVAKYSKWDHKPANIKS